MVAAPRPANRPPCRIVRTGDPQRFGPFDDVEWTIAQSQGTHRSSPFSNAPYLFFTIPPPVRPLRSRSACARRQIASSTIAECSPSNRSS